MYFFGGGVTPENIYILTNIKYYDWSNIMNAAARHQLV